MLSRLKKLMPPSGNGHPGGMVFNMSYGIQGECRYAHVPVMLDLAGVPYTGSGPRGHSICLDKVVTKTLLERAGVPTPRFRSLSSPSERVHGLRYPLVVKPRYESTSNGLELVRDRAGLKRAVEFIVTQYSQDALVEEYIPGREVAVSLLGNDPPEVLPLVEFDFGDRPIKMMTRPDKFHKTLDEPTKICPASLSPALTAQIKEIALAVFHLCQVRDYARIDLRIDPEGNPSVLEVNSMASLGRGGAYVLSAKVAGYKFDDLVTRIVDVAHLRYFGSPATRDRDSRPEIPARPLPGDAAEIIDPAAVPPGPRTA